MKSGWGSHLRRLMSSPISVILGTASVPSIGLTGNLGLTVLQRGKSCCPPPPRVPFVSCLAPVWRAAFTVCKFRLPCEAAGASVHGGPVHGGPDRQPPSCCSASSLLPPEPWALPRTQSSCTETPIHTCPCSRLASPPSAGSSPLSRTLSVLMSSLCIQTPHTKASMTVQGSF